MKTYENIIYRRPNDGRREGVAKDGENDRHTLIYKSQGEKTNVMNRACKYILFHTVNLINTTGKTTILKQIYSCIPL